MIDRMENSHGDIVRKRRESRDRSRVILDSTLKPLLSALIIALVDSLGLFLALGFMPFATLVLLLFLEGGIGLMVGVGISLSSTPSVSRVGETLFGTAPWSRQGEKYAERAGWRWMLASSFLILIGFVLSVS